MNDLQKELNALKEKVAELESRILFPNEPVAKWQPKGGYWQVDCEGDVVAVDSFSHQKEFGTKRITKEQAERAVVEMRRFNRLLALRDELCGDEVVDWGNKDEKKWCLYFDSEVGEWWYACRQTLQYITPYFTTKEKALKACNMLSSGEVEL